MAELTPPLQTYTGARLAVEQFRAIAFLRWRIFANGFRRKGGALEMAGRLLLLPLVGALVLLPAVAAAFFAWYLAMHGTLQYLPLLFWAAFVLTQLLNINLGQPGTTFDPTELIRFPLPLDRYIFVRLSFGVLSPANVLVFLMSGAIFLGVTLDRPRLWPWTLAATGAFALANVLFSRMIFAWVDRWLSTRRSRELFTALIFLGSLLFQYLNVTFNPGFRRGSDRAITPEHLHHAQHLAAAVHPWVRWLPPELSGSAIIAAEHHHTGQCLTLVALVGAYACAFFAIYAFRTRTEYRGENLSDAANAVKSELRGVASTYPERVSSASTPRRSLRPAFVPSTLGPLLAKELLLLRRNTGLLYGVVAPTVMVFLFAGRLSLRGNSHWLLLTAVGYALLGVAPLSYNIFGLEGAGAQLYFYSPVPLREVFLAKNVMQLLLAFFEVFAVTAIVSYVSSTPRLRDIVFALFWAAGTLLLNTTVGNLRSVSAPKKVLPGKTFNRAQSQVSVWIAIGILAGCLGIGLGIQLLMVALHLPWLGLVLMTAFAAASAFAYAQGLDSMERYTLERRDTFFEELGKKS